MELFQTGGKITARISPEFSPEFPCMEKKEISFNTKDLLPDKDVSFYNKNLKYISANIFQKDDEK